MSDDFLNELSNSSKSTDGHEQRTRRQRNQSHVGGGHFEILHRYRAKLHFAALDGNDWYAVRASDVEGTATPSVPLRDLTPGAINAALVPFPTDAYRRSFSPQPPIVASQG